MNFITSLARHLEAAESRTAQNTLRREFAEAHGLSLPQVSRMLIGIGYRANKVRNDAGIRRVEVDEEALLITAKIQASSRSLRKGIIMPAADAVEIAKHNGILPEHITPDYYNDWLSSQQGTRANQVEPTPHIELRSLGPNHVHEADFSACINWKVSNRKLMYEHLIYQNKLPEAGVPRLWRLIVTDHATGVFYVHYGVAAGESLTMFIDGLYAAWRSGKQLYGESIEAKYPFRGLPRILMLDRGSANRAGVTMALLNRLGVKINICSEARAKGAVETRHRHWEQRFESRMRMQDAISVEQLNEWALDFVTNVCGTAKHHRTNTYPSVLWAWHLNRREESKLREINCDVETWRSIAVTEPKLVKVGGSRMIRFKGQKYRVPNCFHPGNEVAVQYSPFSFPAVQVFAVEAPLETYICQPVEADEFGFAKDAVIIGQEYKAPKPSPAATFSRQAAAGAKELAASQSIEAFGYHAKSTPVVEIPTTGENVPVSTEAPAVFQSRQSARVALADRLGRPLTAAEAAFVNETFGEQVSAEEIETAFATIAQGITGKVLSFASRG